MVDKKLTELYKKMFNIEAELDRLNSEVSGIENFSHESTQKIISLRDSYDLLFKLIDIRMDQLKN